MVTSYPEIIKNYTRAILTPNAMEFTRLYNAMVSFSPLNVSIVSSDRILL